MKDDIFIGSSYEEAFSFTQEDVNTFIKLSGDANPIHYDVEYASKSIFKKPIVHGILSSSIISKLIGTKLPGEGSIYLSQNLKFHRPVYVDIDYTAKVEIVSIEGDLIELQTTAKDNKFGKMVISGKAKVKYIGS